MSDLKRCPFPKHKDKLWEDIIEEDPKYVVWLIGGFGPDMDAILYDHLIGLLEEKPEEG